MNPFILAVLPVTKPVAIGIGIAALVVLCLGFKAAKLILKMLLLLGAMLALGLAAWWYYTAHHGAL